MPNYTQNCNLILPKKTENYNVEVANANNQIIDTELANKVEKRVGKDLSTNDFTDGYKNKIDRILEIAKGDSAYQVAVNNGYDGTEQEWLNSIKGEKGDTGDVSITQLNKIIKIMQQLETPTPVIGENLTLNDSKAGKFKSFEIEGNSEQDARSGKNKIDNSKAQLKTSNGLTLSLNETGHLVLNGTSTAVSNFYFTNLSETLKAGAYTLSSSLDLTGKGFYRLIDNNNTNIIQNVLNTNMGINLSEDTVLDTILIQINANVTFNNSIIDLQLESGITKTSFEAYGVSPSTKYPSEIKSCGDNINLFDKDNANIITAFFDESKTTITTSTQSRCIYIPIIGGEDYSVSKLAGVRFNIGTTATVPAVGTALIDNANNMTATNTQKQDTKLSIKTSKNTKYLIVWFYTKDADTKTEQEILNSIKIEKGKVATPYSKYGQGNMNATVSNKNVYNKLKYSLTFNRYIGPTGGISISGSGNYYCTEEYIPFKQFAGKSIITTAQDSTVAFYDKDKKTISITKPTKIAKPIPIDTSYIRFDAHKDYVSTLAIEIGETLEDYILHEEQALTIPTQKPFRSIGNIRDHFIKKGGKNYECHKIKRIIFDGTENFNIVNNETNWKQFRMYLSNLNLKSEKILSNYFNYSGLSETFAQKLEAVTFDTNKNVRFSFKSETMTLADFKAMLAQKHAEGHPVYIDYVLTEPELILCTDEQNAILDEIEDNAETYDDCTHIYSTDEVAPNFEVTYCKDINKIFNDITA